MNLHVLLFPLHPHTLYHKTTFMNAGYGLISIWISLHGFDFGWNSDKMTQPNPNFSNLIHTHFQPIP
jgi:hypothetical protein